MEGLFFHVVLLWRMLQAQVRVQPCVSADLISVCVIDQLLRDVSISVTNLQKFKLCVCGSLTQSTKSVY